MGLCKKCTMLISNGHAVFGPYSDNPSSWIHCHHEPRLVERKCVCELTGSVYFNDIRLGNNAEIDINMAVCKFCPECGRKLYAVAP